MKVFLRSEEFGEEIFEPKSLREAVEMIQNIHRDAVSEQDGIEREVGIRFTSEKKR